MKQKAGVIGSGIAGISSAIRLALKGYDTDIFEQADRPGGKIGTLQLDGYRFDTGPSLFTMPSLVDELFEMAGKNPGDYFRYQPLTASCKYFWEDGLIINAWKDADAFAREIDDKTAVTADRVHAFLRKSERLYKLTNEVFLFNSFHRIRNYLSPAYRRSLFGLHELDAFMSMHKKNSRWFSDKRIVQLFDRYATYNGSNPYKTPATLNIIPHLEHNIGAFFPEKGMYQIIEALHTLAGELGVRFHFNSPVEEILLDNRTVKGLRAAGKTYEFDLVTSDVDIVTLYKQLLPSIPVPRRQLSLERSTSALIFYWGINRSFPDLKLHNILFSDDYEGEFDHLFHKKTITDDPTVYIFISAKAVPEDAPPGKENWYVMINVPENTGQDWDKLIGRARHQITEKISRITGIDINQHIEKETIADPRSIEKDTGSYRGSLYGLSSNNTFAAFSRHPNFKKWPKNLYFTGGSVHPGGGIPLCLASAKIVDKEIANYKTR
ncbi:MAG: 1-hydroxycarotenoid 3,4-desaturase CrtD [Bacteroidales bacterium]